MVHIPENTVTPEDIAEWQDLAAQISIMKAKETLLRAKIYKGMFTAPVEGTNTVDLFGGWKLKAVRKVERKIDLPLLQAIALENGPLHVAGIRADDLVKWKPELNLPAYRLLTEAQKLVFDTCLEIKDGSPSVDLVPPKAVEKV